MKYKYETIKKYIIDRPKSNDEIMPQAFNKPSISSIKVETDKGNYWINKEGISNLMLSTMFYSNDVYCSKSELKVFYSK